jgi:hypothetical protein
VIHALLPGVYGDEISGLYLRKQGAEMISTTDKSMGGIAAIGHGGRVSELRPFVHRLTRTLSGDWVDQYQILFLCTDVWVLVEGH